MIDHQFLREHRPECSYLFGRFMVEHLIRVIDRFEGDVIAAVVLGTIAQYNVRRFYDEVVVSSQESFIELVARGAQLPHIRPCNAMSVSESTGIPRETVRRKVKWLVSKGWIVQAGRDKLYLTPGIGEVFAEFDSKMMEEFGVLLGNLERARERVTVPRAKTLAVAGAARRR